MADWIVIYKSAILNNVEIVKAVLADNNIFAVIVNKTDSMYPQLTNGDIELNVNSNDVISAKHLITKHQL